ncbi:uncharacterized protein A4U43_C07F10040 [Asparagus officinalis]|uniref:Uncharacterized protein n=1 Tax=Asparagus officinalis TaxID=4686 RepID=A0A5P1EDT6_ASPOF|nr:uncharacterized protein A4U43_C07F10040 [Asparagus officinalis]
MMDLSGAAEGEVERGERCAVGLGGRQRMVVGELDKTAGEWPEQVYRGSNSEVGCSDAGRRGTMGLMAVAMCIRSDGCGFMYLYDIFAVGLIA